MRFLIKLLFIGLTVFALSYFFPEHILITQVSFLGITLTGYLAALGVALILALLNAIVRPILVFLTIPITIITLGLFLIIINGFIIWLADKMMTGFMVESFTWMVIMSLVLTVITYILDAILYPKRR